MPSTSPEHPRHNNVIAITRTYGLTVIEEPERRTPFERDLAQAAANQLLVEDSVASAQARARREIDNLAKAVLDPTGGARGSVESAGAAFAAFIEAVTRVEAAQREVELTGDAYARANGKKKADR